MSAPASSAPTSAPAAAAVLDFDALYSAGMNVPLRPYPVYSHVLPPLVNGKVVRPVAAASVPRAPADPAAEAEFRARANALLAEEIAVILAAKPSAKAEFDRICACVPPAPHEGMLTDQEAYQLLFFTPFVDPNARSVKRALSSPCADSVKSRSSTNSDSAPKSLSRHALFLLLSFYFWRRLCSKTSAF